VDVFEKVKWGEKAGAFVPLGWDKCSSLLPLAITSLARAAITNNKAAAAKCSIHMGKCKKLYFIY
jgi:hypothetical protein